ncbi:MAG: glycosyltransferase family 4 protein [Saprospiraceae bacterium]
MKIAYISYEFPTYTGFGGIAFYIRKIAGIMSSQGNAVHVITARPGSDEDQIEHISGQQIHYLGVKSQKDFRQRVPGYMKLLVSSEKFDVIESAEYGADTIGLIGNISDFTNKYIVRIHGITLLSAIYDTRKWKEKGYLYGIAIAGRYDILAKVAGKFFPLARKLIIKNHLEQKIAKAADVITVPSRRMDRFISDYWGIPKNRLLKIPNPAPFRPFYREQFLEDRLIVGFVNKWQYLKGSDLFEALIKDIYRLKDERFFCDVRLYGSISDEARQVLAKKYSPFQNGCLSILGNVSAEEVETAMKTIDCLVLPSRYESFSNVLLEAMSKGCLVCVSDGVGAGETITDGENGFLFRSGDKRSLLETFRRIAALTPEERLRISRNATRTVEGNFSDKHIYQVYSAIYRGQHA